MYVHINFLLNSPMPKRPKCMYVWMNVWMNVWMYVINNLVRMNECLLSFFYRPPRSSWPTRWWMCWAGWTRRCSGNSLPRSLRYPIPIPIPILDSVEVYCERGYMCMCCAVRSRASSHCRPARRTSWGPWTRFLWTPPSPASRASRPQQSWINSEPDSAPSSAHRWVMSLQTTFII